LNPAPAGAITFRLMEAKQRWRCSCPHVPGVRGRAAILTLFSLLGTWPLSFLLFD
jgi:hypothetical protein